MKKIKSYLATRDSLTRDFCSHCIDWCSGSLLFA